MITSMAIPTKTRTSYLNIADNFRGTSRKNEDSITKAAFYRSCRLTPLQAYSAVGSNVDHVVHGRVTWKFDSENTFIKVALCGSSNEKWSRSCRFMTYLNANIKDGSTMGQMACGKITRKLKIENPITKVSLYGCSHVTWSRSCRFITFLYTISNVGSTPVDGKIKWNLINHEEARSRVSQYGSSNVTWSRSCRLAPIKSKSKAGSGLDHMINGEKVNGVRVEEGSHMELKKRELIKDEEDGVQGFMVGKFVEDRFVYRQTFIIRSYEIGPDKTATMETLMNLLQETALNHVTSSGVAGNGFGATREMSLRKLIWVVTRIHLHVLRYSSWGDVIEIDTWVDAAGKNAMRRDWIIRDYTTQQIITRATSTWVIMNRDTRKLSKIPAEVRQEVEPFYLQRYALETGEDITHKINKLTDDTAHIIRSGLAPRWSDMDANLHVNNVKYIGWILESVPIEVLEDYNLTSMTLEYRRECRQANVLESLTTLKPDYTIDDESSRARADIESTHLLRLQDNKVEIVRARTEWHSKSETYT